MITPWLLSLNIMTSSFSFWRKWIFIIYLRLNILLCKHATHFFTTWLVTDDHIGWLRSDLLWILLPLTQSAEVSFSSVVHLVRAVLDWRVVLICFKEIYMLFPRDSASLHVICSPHPLWEVYLVLFSNSHSGKCEVIGCCGLNWHFPSICSSSCWPFVWWLPHLLLPSPSVPPFPPSSFSSSMSLLITMQLFHPF